MKIPVSLLAFICVADVFVKRPEHLNDAAFYSNETRLYKDVFENYNKYNRPVLKESQAVIVEFDYQLIRIIDVSAKDQFIKTYAWINQYWRSPQLTWDPNKYGGIKEIHVSPFDIWVPDILLYNNVDDEDHFGGGRYTYKTNVAMKYDGNTTWLNPGIFKSICKVDVTYFPFDNQKCFMKFGSWSFDSSKVDLRAPSGGMFNKNYVKNGEWKVTLLQSQRNQLKYQCCPHAFVDVTIHIELQRESLDFILKLIIPCSLISSMIFLGFVLPPESGERIGLSITVLLAMTVFQQLSSELMPSYGFPLLGQYYFACMVEIGASLFVTTLILNFYHRNSRRMPKFLRILILRWLARVVFPEKSSTKDWNPIETNKEASDAPHKKGSFQSADQGSDSDDMSLSHDDSSYDHQMPKMSPTYSDPWIPLQKTRYSYGFPANGKIHHNDNNGGFESELGYGAKCSTFSKKCNFHRERNKSIRRKSSCQHRYHGRRSFPKEHSSPSISTSVLLDLNQKERQVSPQMMKNQKEWIKAARVLDRLFLIVSVLVGVTTLLGIFIRAPRFR